MKEAIILIALFLSMIAGGIPLYLALIASSIIVIFSFDMATMYMPSQIFISSISKWALLAIPFFIFAGNLLANMKSTRKMVDFSRFISQKLPHRVPIATILSGIFFAGISGSGPADTAALGTFLIPELKKDGYDDGFSAALIAAAGSVGIIIPPSIALIIYGSVAQVSIGKLFFAGIIPGILIGASLIGAVFIYYRKHKFKPEAVHFTLEDFGIAIFSFIAPLIILGGIYGGIFTPTEAAAIAALYTLFIGLIFREITLKKLFKITCDSMRTSASIMLLIAGAALFSAVLIRTDLNEHMSEFFNNTEMSKLTFLLLINIVLLILGCFLDAISIFYIMIPLILPIATQTFGIDPVQLGIIFTVNLAIGQITPPIGVNLYVAAGVGKTKFERLIRPALFLITAEFIVLALVSLIPQLSMMLASLTK